MADNFPTKKLPARARGFLTELKARDRTKSLLQRYHRCATALDLHQLHRAAAYSSTYNEAKHFTTLLSTTYSKNSDKIKTRRRGKSTASTSVAPRSSITRCSWTHDFPALHARMGYLPDTEELIWTAFLGRESGMPSYLEVLFAPTAFLKSLQPLADRHGSPASERGNGRRSNPAEPTRPFLSAP